MNTIHEEDKARARVIIASMPRWEDGDINEKLLPEHLAQALADARPVITEDVGEKAREILGPCSAGHEKHCSLLFDRIATALAAQPSVDDAPN